MQVAACRTPFVSQGVSPARNSAFSGCKLSSKAVRVAARKTSMTTQAKVCCSCVAPLLIDGKLSRAQHIQHLSIFSQLMIHASLLVKNVGG